MQQIKISIFRMIYLSEKSLITITYTLLKGSNKPNMKNLLTPQLKIWKWSTVCPDVAKHLKILKFQFIFFWITMQLSLKLIQSSSDQATQLYIDRSLIINLFYLTLTVWTVLFFYFLLFTGKVSLTHDLNKKTRTWMNSLHRYFYQYFLIKKFEIRCGKIQLVVQRRSL